MNKKFLRVFVNSFVISLFAIWVADELMLVSKTQAETIDVPESNISLFLQSKDNFVAPIKAVGVSASSLGNIQLSKTEPLTVDESIFTWETVRLNSVDEVSDIPLEYSKDKATPAKESIKISQNDQLLPAVTPATPAENSAPEEPLSHEKLTSLDSEMGETEVLSATAKEETKQVNAEDDSVEIATNDNFGIPLQKGLPENLNNIITANTIAASNQVAMLRNADSSIDTLKVNTVEQKKDEKAWTHMSDIAPLEKNIIDEGKTLTEAVNITPEVMGNEDQEVQVAEMVKNILIPIPEDILKDKNLKPQLVSPKKSSKGNVSVVTQKDVTSEDMPAESKAKSGGLFKSLTSMFSGSEGAAAGKDGEEVSESKDDSKKGGLFSILGKKKQSTAKILPAEMKLSFQPSRAEISGQTLRWIEAFATKAADEDSIFLEIRIDGNSSFELQQKRLNLLYRILANKGVNGTKINTVFTTREPNSFIIRTLKMSDNNNTVQKNNNRQASNYRSW